MTTAVAKSMLHVEHTCNKNGNSLDIMSEGMAAAMHDDEEGELTDNPYTSATPLAQADWYSGYNYWMEHKDEPA